MTDVFKDIEKPARDPAEASDDPRVAFWAAELRLARERDRTYWKQAERVVKLYEGEKHEDNSFNILYANTETLLPSCYNQLPRPFVDRRFHDPDPIAKFGAKVLERTLTELTKCEDSDYDPFSELMEQAVLGALLPGRGVTWFRYETKISVDTPSVDDEETEGENSPQVGGAGDADPAGQVTGEEVIEIPSEKVEYETVCGEDVDYNEFLHGYARAWSKVPWVARRHLMIREDVEVSFGKTWVDRLPFSTKTKNEGGEYKTKAAGGEEEEAQHGSQPTAMIWEIWNKEKHEVVFYCPQYGTSLVKVLDDPLEIPGFFPCHEPLRFLKKRSKLTPTPPYTLYEEQAKELNRVTQRINRLIHGLKVRGFYDGTVKGLKELLNSADNTLLEARDVAVLQDGKTLENSIWLMPLDKIITVIKELYINRDQCKETIYEITGIADIMRGEGEASATATQERIKNQWGTLRLKRMQRYVQEYVRGCLNIMGAIAANHFSQETFAAMTNLDYSTSKQVKQAQKVMQQVQQVQAQSAMAPPQQAAGPVLPGAPPTPAPAGPPPLPPQIQQMAQEAQALLQKPQWEPILKLLKDDMSRYYRIDIETNSTIAADTQEDKQNITEAMTAISNMYESFLPVVQAGAMTMSALKAMLLTVVRRFNMGREVEDEVNALPDQLPPQPAPDAPPPEALELEKAKIAAAQAKLNTEQQLDQINLESAKGKHAMDMQLRQIDIAGIQRRDEADKQVHAFKMQQSQAEQETVEATRRANVQKALTDAALAQQQRELAPALAANELAAKKTKDDLEIAKQQRSSELELGHQKAKGDMELEQGAKSGEQKVALDKKASDSKIESTKKASDAKLAADVKAAEKETTDPKVKQLLDEVITLLKTPAKGRVTARGDDGKILDVDFSRG